MVDFTSNVRPFSKSTSLSLLADSFMFSPNDGHRPSNSVGFYNIQTRFFLVCPMNRPSHLHRCVSKRSVNFGLGFLQSEEKKGSASKQCFRRCTHIVVIRFIRWLSVEFVFPILAAILSNLRHLEARRTESVHATDCKSEWSYSDCTSVRTLAVFCQIRCVICNNSYSATHASGSI